MNIENHVIVALCAVVVLLGCTILVQQITHPDALGKIAGTAMPRGLVEWFWDEFGDRVVPLAQLTSLGIVHPSSVLDVAAGLEDAWLLRVDEPDGGTSLVFLELRGRRTLWHRMPHRRVCDTKTHLRAAL